MKLRIKELRESRGETQFDLSIATGIQVSVICRVETGATKNPRIGTPLKIARHYGVPIEELFAEK